MHFTESSFFSVYSILQMELYFPNSVKNHSQISALGCLESFTNKKGAYIEKESNS